MLLWAVSVRVSSSALSSSLRGFTETSCLLCQDGPTRPPPRRPRCRLQPPRNPSCIPRPGCSRAVPPPADVGLVGSPVGPCARWDDSRSRWMSGAAARWDALQLQTFSGKGLEQNSDLNCTNATNCTPNYSYLQSLLLLVKNSQAEVCLYCISCCLT